MIDCNTAVIITANNNRILIDAKCLKFLKKYSWHITSKGYAATSVKRKRIYMHRLLLNAGELQVDHINHNKLDNRKVNLRLVTNQQNHFNEGLSKNNKSGVKGVHWNKACKKWCVQITLNGKCIHSELVSDLEDAKQLRLELEAKYFKFN